MSQGNGFASSLWGNCLWYILEMISFNYPEHPTTLDKSRYKNFICSIQYVLPCGTCRTNMQKYMPTAKLDAALSSRHAFTVWMHKFRKHVAESSGKTFAVTHRQLQTTYNRLRTRSGKECNTKGVVKIIPRTRSCRSLTIDPKCKF